MNKFEERYENLTNPELPEILEKRDDYQPEAARAAEKEIESREVSTCDILEFCG